MVLGAQIVLAAVFVTAGVAKLLDLRGARRALIGFGVPEGAAAVLGLLLPLAELAVAGALVPAESARLGAVGALLLLVAFAVGIANAIARGRAPDCNCFGNLHSAPAGPATLARNLGLAALAGFVVWRGPDTEVGDWVTARSAAELVAVGAALAALALAALARGLWSENRALRRALAVAREAPPPQEPEGLPIGAPAPAFELTGIGGEVRTLESLRAGGRPVVLVFFDPGCGPCWNLLPHVPRWQAALQESLPIAVISDGDAERTRAVWAGRSVEVLLERDRAVSQAYRIRSWPAAVAIGPDGRIASAPALRLDTMEVLIRTMLNGGPAAVRSPNALPWRLTLVQG